MTVDLGDGFSVDWQRRRILRSDAVTATHCAHHARLIEWCPTCETELDQIAADMCPDA